MDHLTTIPHATLLAWHTAEDIQAVRIGETCEELYVDGRYIPLTDDLAHPTQQVINYCSARKRTQSQFRKLWTSLATEAE